MPGWLIHLAFAYLIAKILKIRDIFLVLLGALLPDVARFFTIIDFLNLSANSYYAYLEPTHSPFLVIILALAISFLTKKPQSSFLFLLLGAFTHHFLDQLQSNYYTGKLLLYPFSYHPFKSIQVFWPDSTFAFVLMIISFFILLYAIFDKKKTLNLTLKKVHIFLILFLIYLIVPLLTFNTFMEKSPYLNHFENNKEIYFSYSVITSENPLKIKEMDYEYEIINKIDFKKGDWISAKAELIGNKVLIKEYHKHKRHIKTTSSIIGLIMLVIFFFKNPKRYK